jgi:hypothetical protein
MGRPGDFGLRGRCSQWVGWARGQAGRTVDRAKNQEKKIAELKLDLWIYQGFGIL